MKEQKQPFPLLRGMAQGLFDTVESMDGEELRTLEQEINSLTETNCWWAIWSVANIIKDSASYALALEQAEKKIDELTDRKG